MPKAYHVFLLGSVLAVPFLGASGAHAFQIINHARQNCLSVEDDNTANGTPIRTVPCTGSFGQQWKWEGFAIKGIGTSDGGGPLGGGFNKCVFAGFSTPRGPRPVQLDDCNGAGPQQWVFSNAFISGGGLQIINVPTGQCLDVGDGANNTQAALQTCRRGAAGQFWRLR